MDVTATGGPRRSVRRRSSPAVRLDCSARCQRTLLRQRFGFDPPRAEIPRAQLEPLRAPLTEIFTGPHPVAGAYREHGYTLREIAEHLGCHYSTVSRRLRREEEALLQCKT